MRTKWKVILSILIIIIVMGSSAIAQPDLDINIDAVIDNNYSNEPNIIINNSPIDAEAIIINERAYIPIRIVSENMNGIVEWNSEEKIADVTYNNKNVEFSYYSGDVEIIDEKMYIPLRVASEALEFDVDWKPETKTVIINTNDN